MHFALFLAELKSDKYYFLANNKPSLFRPWLAIFYKQISGPFSVNLKAKDIHFLGFSEKETIFVVGAW